MLNLFSCLLAATWLLVALPSSAQTDSAAVPVNPARLTGEPPTPAPISRALTGSVSDEMNTPMSGVTVRLAGLNRPLCVTNSQGKFLLEVPVASPATLIVSFAGYYEQQLYLPREAELHVVLLPLPGFHRRGKAAALYRRRVRAHQTANK